MNISKILWGDFETRSSRPIKSGPHVYAEDSTPLLMTYAFGMDDVKVWRCLTEPMPTDLRDALSDPTVILAFHNVDFDRTQMVAWAKKFPEWAGFDLNPRRFLCTMTWAQMCRFPGSLDALCKALEVPMEDAKQDGSALIRKFCVPGKDGKYRACNGEDFERFVVYAVKDVDAMRACALKLPKVFSAIERELFAFTTEMNDRGILIDRELAVAAAFDSVKVKAALRRQGEAIGNELEEDSDININSQKAMLDLLRGFGINLDDMRINTVERFLESTAEMPTQIRQLLLLRLAANKTSVAKYAAVLRNVCEDNGLRGLVRFYGAGTGRDAGRRFQPQNLPRPVYVGERMKSLGMEEACEIIKRGEAELFVQQPLQLMADCVRGLLVARPGKRFCVADLSSIEGRVLPWMAEEEWKTQYYRDLDAKRVRYDGYQLAYGVAFGVDPSTVTKAQRTLGKPIELATGYQGGVGALLSFAAVYRIDVVDMARKAISAANPELLAQCYASYDWFVKKKITHGLDRDTFVGLLYIVKAWRAQHPKTVALWASCEDAFRMAVANPKVRFLAAKDTYMFSMKGWVFIELPSKRLLVYPHAKVEDDRCSFKGINPFNKKYGTIYTYSGKLCENIDQAIARDVLFHNIKRVEEAGYPILLRVHDEVITEPDDLDSFTGDALARIISTPHSWCETLPLNAAGETLYRYQK